MPFFLITWLICTVLGVAFPGFTKFLNYGFLFPLMTIAIGSLLWSFLGLITDTEWATQEVWMMCTGFVGLPLGAMIAYNAENG